MMKLPILSILCFYFLLILLTNQQCILIQNQSIENSHKKAFNIRQSANLHKKHQHLSEETCITKEQCSQKNGFVVTKKQKNGVQKQVCKFCRLNEKWNGTECQCQPGFSKNNQGKCLGNLNLKEASGKLSTPVIISPKKPDCILPAVKVNNSCACPNNTEVYSLKGCILNPCTNFGEEWDTIKYRCKCQEKYEFIKGKCVTKCKLNQIWSETTKSCICNKRSAIVGGKCALCDKNAVKKENNLCQCKKGYVGTGFECKKTKK